MKLGPGDRALFLDMNDVESVDHALLNVCEAQKHPDNPILPLGDMHEWDSVQARPWETRTIIYDEEDRLFKCWYTGTDLSTDRWWASGYAVSDDGIRWTKPNLGLCEYRGSKDNNILFIMGWGPVLKDPAEPDPARRYKMVWRGSPRERGTRAYYSPDGIHWTEGARIDLPEWGGGGYDIVLLLRDDQDPDPSRRYKMVWQISVPATKPGPQKVRAKCLACGPDIEHLKGVQGNPILSPNDGLEQENHFLMLFPWRGQYVMAYEYGWYMPTATGVFGQYCADIRLAVSRDGERFLRIRPDQKVIPRGPRGQWDDGFLVIADKPVVKDGLVYLYYCGNGEDWTSWPGGNIVKGYPYASTGCMRLSRMGLATLPIDRFTCLQTPDRETPGTVTTRPVELARLDGRLVLNASGLQPNRSWIDVEALHAAEDRALEGFGLRECQGVHCDGLAVPIGWKARRMSDLPSPRVRLRFRLCGAARLHAFGLEV